MAQRLLPTLLVLLHVSQGRLAMTPIMRASLRPQITCHMCAHGERSVPVVGPLRRRLRRRKDAATLLELTSGLETLSKDPLYLTKEKSLSSVASDIWTELGSTLPEGQASRFEKVINECSAGFSELGQAAQAKLTSKDPVEAQAKLLLAGERAKRAVEEVERIAGTYAEAADEARAVSSRQFNEAWRRDAVRAVLALQRAPEQLQREMKRQQLKALSKELRILGLERQRLDTLTQQDVRAARAARAKMLHPDLVGANVPAADAVAKDECRSNDESNNPPRGLFGLVRSFFSSTDRRRHEGDADVECVLSNEDAMIELNDAFDAVYKAVSAPVHIE